MHECACLVEKISLKLDHVNLVLISRIKPAHKTIQGHYTKYCPDPRINMCKMHAICFYADEESIA